MGMVRGIAAVIAGYIVMALWVFITMTVAFISLGPGFAFQGDTFDVSLGWVGLALSLGLAGAVLGGLAAALIAKRAAPVKALAAIILGLGIVFAVLRLVLPAPAVEDPAPASPSAVSTIEAAANARQPVWYQFTIPFVGFAGVLLGGQILRRRSDPEAPAVV